MKLSEAQKQRRDAVLRDVIRSGGRDGWHHLSSHGHHYAVVQACINRGELSRHPDNYFRYEITPAGRSALEAE